MVGPERSIFGIEADEGLREVVTTVVDEVREKHGDSSKVVFFGGIREFNEAVKEADERGVTIALVIVDVDNSPGSLPEEVVTWMGEFHKKRPDTPMIGMGILPSGETTESIKEKIGTDFLQTPFDVEVLVKKVEQAFT